MEKPMYTDEKNVLILISLLKAHGIHRVIASPGTTNLTFVASIEDDDFFEVYSSVDERSAAYIACGMAAESGEPVALSCTGATASRNYVPGLTEAYYRKLPVLAITATQDFSRIGQNIPQVIDRRVQQNDVVKKSFQIPTVRESTDVWGCQLKINEALLELRRDGGGPVLINYVTTYSQNYSVDRLPAVNAIRRYVNTENLPEIKFDKSTKIAIFVGSHAPFSQKLTDSIDTFCKKYGAVVVCDHAANYRGKHEINANLISSQEQYTSALRHVDLLIHIGNITGNAISMLPSVSWRVDPDGEIRDTFQKLGAVFQMSEITFFDYYNNLDCKTSEPALYEEAWVQENRKIYSLIPELPFSNAWIAQRSSMLVPDQAILHLGILNSIRCWNLFNIPESVHVFSNTGGFGIDGDISALLGSSLVDTSKLNFIVLGDLAFFYDMNSIGNRHLGSNVRILLVNNGRGTEFRNYNHNAAAFGDEADRFMAAGGHFGQQSSTLVRHYSEDLGFTYLSARNKSEFEASITQFFDPEPADAPILLEVFTDSKDESDALRILNNLMVSKSDGAKKLVKRIVGKKGVEKLKKILR